MAEISKINISRLFSRMSGEGDPAVFDGLIDMAYNKLMGLLNGRELSSEEAARVEYAAAADVAYAYTLERAAREELMFTENGQVKRRCSDLDVVKAANKRRDYAFSQLVGIVSLDDPIFKAIKG